MVAQHLSTEAEFNFSPYGLTVVTTTGTTPKPPPPPAPPNPSASCNAAVKSAKYDSVWMGGAPDWASLQISLGSTGIGIDSALAMAEKELDHYRSTLRDQWNIHGLTANDGYGVDGQPWCTAHYGFHMPLWHIPFAMSGQTFSAVAETLRFAPKLPCPFSLPMLVPGAVGTLSCDTPVHGFTLRLQLGKLNVTTLSVFIDGKEVFKPGGAKLRAGEEASWP